MTTEQINKNIIHLFSNWDDRKDDYPGAIFISIYETLPLCYRINYNDKGKLSYKTVEKDYCVAHKIDINKLVINLKNLSKINKDILIFNYSANEYLVCSLNENLKFILLITVTSSNSIIKDYIELYTDNIDEVFKTIKSCFQIRKKEDNNYEFGIAAIDVTGGLYTSYYEYKYQDIDVKKNYNDDLPYEKICQLINREDKPDLMLFYGPPGTGKSSFIKHLICKYQDKDWVFMDGNILGGSSKEKLMSYFLDNPNTIFILEDCEKILVSREKEFNPVMSILLNVTDSTISDILGIKFICTFNTSINNIDEALLRKGRLSLKYEFKDLCLEKCKEINPNIDKPMKLADLYNIDEENDFSKKEHKKIGF